MENRHLFTLEQGKVCRPEDLLVAAGLDRPPPLALSLDRGAPLSEPCKSGQVFQKWISPLPQKPGRGCELGPMAPRAVQRAAAPGAAVPRGLNQHSWERTS